jgi:hypothetical protein
MIAPNVIIPYDSTHASIPAGFTRETALDGKYPKGAPNATEPNQTGGASTHTHTSPAHSHTLADHSHSGRTDWAARTADETTGSGSGPLDQDHYHNFNFAGRSGGTTSADAVTYSAVSNEPPYYTVIFIKASQYAFIPANGMVLSASTSRASLTFHSASAGKFLKGAGTGANAGSTGGSSTNVHDISHSHTAQGHTHSGTTAGATPNSASPDNGGTNALGDHTHSLTLTSGTQGINAFSGTLTTAETVEPGYRTLNAFKNAGASPIMPIPGDVAMWLGSLATIPSGWYVCDGNNGTPDMRDRFIKISASASSTTTGGSHTHTHASQAHSHTSSGTHTHGQSVSNHSGNKGLLGNAHIVAVPNFNHNQGAQSTSSTTAGYDAGTTTADSSNNEPEYRTVAYIQMKFSTVGGSFLFNMI